MDFLKSIQSVVNAAMIALSNVGSAVRTSFGSVGTFFSTLLRGGK